MNKQEIKIHPSWNLKFLFQSCMFHNWASHSEPHTIESRWKKSYFCIIRSTYSMVATCINTTLI